MSRFVLFFFVICMFIAGCKKDSNITDSGQSGGSSTEAKLVIRIDPRVELLSVIQYLSSSEGRRNSPLIFAYRREVDQYFKNFSNHIAVTTTDKLADNGFNYDAPIVFLLYHSNPPEFKRILPYSSYLIQRAGSEAVLTDYAAKISDFAKVADFQTFYNSHLSFYKQIETKIQNTIGDTNYIKILEDYYGEKKNNYTLIPAPLFYGVGYGPQIITEKGTDIYNIFGASKSVNDMPDFGSKESILFYLMHEFSHAFVNPVTEKNAAEINRSSFLMEPIRDVMIRQGYTNWSTCVNEHLIRACNARFAFHQRGRSLETAFLQDEISKGFIFVGKLDTLLQKYEGNRIAYPTFSSFYPEIIKFFNSQK